MIDVNTKILGLIGDPLGHSISPLLHNHTINKNNLNYVYLPFPIKADNFADALKGFRAINVRGLNVTIPYKEKVIPYLDKIDPLAEKIAAVNTIFNDDGLLTGYNTDLTGLIRMIKEEGDFQIKEKKVMIVGAGGAARASGIAVLSEGVDQVYLVNRTTSKSAKLTKEWQMYYPGVKIYNAGLDAELYQDFIGDIDLLIDTTPVGMSPNIDVPPVIKAEYLHSNMLVVDLVYNPQETSLIKAAKDAGAVHLNGLGMLLYQGIESFKIWTGFEIDVNSWKNLLEAERKLD